MLRFFSTSICTVLGLCLWCPYPSSADEVEPPAEDPLLDEEEAPVFETVVHGYEIRPTDNVTGFARTLDVNEESRGMTSVSEVVSQAVGVQVRRTGGLGSYGTASIRGSTPGQVPVYMDGVLLNTGGFAAVNLGDLTLDSLDRIEIYRGYTPVSLGTAGIGGAISLSSRAFDEPITEISMSYGSWNTARLLALRGDRVDDVRALTILSASGSQGDFEYLNRNGTLLNEEDDAIQRRQNNRHVSYGSLVKIDGNADGRHWTLANDLTMKRQGIPGVSSIPTKNVSLRTLRDSLSARLETAVDKNVEVTLDARYMVMHEDYSDLDNEIGIGHQRTVSRGDSAGGGALLGIRAGDHQSIAVGARSRYERFTTVELLTGIEPDPASRVISSLALEYSLAPSDDALLVPALRLEHHHGVFGGGPVAGTGLNVESASFDDFYVQPSLGLRYEIVSGLFLRANAGRFVRPPDLAELFGDRGAVTGNRDLKPELSLNADLGLTYMVTDVGFLSTGRFECAGFGSRVEDLIVYVQNSQNTVRPENVNKADILGVETSLGTGWADVVFFEANYTFLHAVNRSDRPFYYGKRLPGRPAHEAYGKIEIRHPWEKWAGALWFDVDYAGSNYLDQANMQEDTLARLFLGLGVRAERLPEKLSLTVEIRNLLDTITVKDEEGRLRPVRDFEAFPLPGRTILATINWRT